MIWFFFFWLGLHACYVIVAGLLVPSSPEAWPSALGDWLVVALWYFIGFSWLLRPSEPSPFGFTLGFALYACGGALVIAARLVNPYFIAAVVAPPEVITRGVYGWLKHPGYWGFVAMGLGTLLLLGHVLGLIPLAAYSAVLMWRARREGRLTRSVSEDQAVAPDNSLLSSQDDQSTSVAHR